MKKTYTQGIADASNIVHGEMRAYSEHPASQALLRNIYLRINNLLEEAAKPSPLPEGRLVYENSNIGPVAVIPVPKTQAARELFAQNKENLEQVLDDMAELERLVADQAARIVGLDAQLEDFRKEVAELTEELRTERQHAMAA